MKTLHLALICAAVAMFGSAVLAESDKDAATLNEIAGYRQWMRVNPKPVEVSVPVTRSAGAIAIEAGALS